MAKRQFLMLAHPYKPSKHGIAGWWASEKMDGQRCFWDGGITNGLLKSEVPWANCAKDGRYVSAPIATGLWSRYGNVIHAPDWFLNELPNMPLDGELVLPNYQARQELMSIIKKQNPTEEWKHVTYKCYGVPSPEVIFAEGEVKVTNYEKRFTGIMDWMNQRNVSYCDCTKATSPFRNHLFFMKKHLLGDVAVVHPQLQLSMSEPAARDQVEHILEQVLEVGGEGLILRDPNTPWLAERSHTLLKHKPFDDMEGYVMGYTTGRETDKGSKLLGKMGAMILEISGGIRLELSGFTDNERELTTIEGQKIYGEAYQWAVDHPEEEVPNWIAATYFPRGTKVSFKYRGKSNDGVPQEARYWRKDERI